MRFNRKEQNDAEDKAHEMTKWIERIENRVIEVERRVEDIESKSDLEKENE